MIEDVERMVSEEVSEDETGPALQWVIENDQEADWAIKKIKEAQAEADRWREYYNAMTAKVEEKSEQTKSFMMARLREYFDKVPHKDTKTTEKYPLPSGDLIFKKPKKVFNHDDSVLLNWLKENGFFEFVKVTEKPDWAGFKKRLTEDSNGIICDSETGLVCDAVTSEMSEPDFEVK